MKNLSMFMAAALAFGASSLIKTQNVFADASSNDGALRGQIKDKGANEPAVGATVVATSPALQGEQVVITDDTGQYFITALPPGVYTLTVYYNDATYSRSNVLVQVGKEVVVNVSVNSQENAGKPKGEVINIAGSAPIVDQGSTKTGVTITDDYTRNVPVGRTFGEVIGASAGSQGDLYGTSFSGATSVENTYVVEGINTTDTAYGLLSSNLPNEFVSETEVITGGYNAEYGRATGGIVNVATKQGSNEFHGSVFANYSPDGLTAAAKTIQSGGAIDAQLNPGNVYDIGAEVGGPILKDKLWFHVGFDPTVNNQSIKRFVNSLTDANQDGVPDTDSNGDLIKQNVSSSTISGNTKTYFFTAKINGAIDQNNQFQISAFGNPSNAVVPINPASTTLTNQPGNETFDQKSGAWDVAAKWTSKLNQGKTQIDAIVGFHRAYNDVTAANAVGSEAEVYYNYTRPLTDFTDLEGSQITAACTDGGPGDKYSKIVNCPVTNYSESGQGNLPDSTNDRITAALTVTQRVKAAGYHTFKAGVDYEGSSYDSITTSTGGFWRFEGLNPPSAAGGSQQWFMIDYIHIVRNLTPAEQADPSTVTLGKGELICASGTALCNSPGNQSANTGDRSIGAFLQDSWQILPNFTVNVGVRYENQQAGIAQQLQGTIAPTGETIGTTGFDLNNWAPRLGFIWDPTQEGKAKIYGHYGRFYENVPMDLNVRSFGGEIDNINIVNASQLTPGQPGFNANCIQDHKAGVNIGAGLAQCDDIANLQQAGGGTEYVTPNLGGQYSNEYILGAEYEILPDVKAGINYIHRDLGQVIEDTLQNGSTYFITNPGENLDSEAATLQTKANTELMSSDPAVQKQGAIDAGRADGMTRIKNMDPPSRNYDAVQLQLTQRPTKQSLILASYTYSKEQGNYPGLFSTETGQLDPNITSEYDLASLLANHYGPMGLDRPHLLKVDGFYQFDLKTAGLLTIGGSARVQSGIPHNLLGADAAYGPGETYILARGSEPRSPTSSEIDLHLSYGYRLTKTTTLQIFMDVFNILNTQQQATTDDNYTFDSVHPIVNGDMSDVSHLKTIDPNNGNELNVTPIKNPDYAKTTAYLQAPRTWRFGFRLTF